MRIRIEIIFSINKILMNSDHLWDKDKEWVKTNNYKLLLIKVW